MLIDDFRPPRKPTQESVKNIEGFQTPEEVAATDDIKQVATMPVTTEEGSGPNKIGPDRAVRAVPKKRSRFAMHWPPGKKEWIVAIVVLLLISAGIFGFLSHNHHPKTIATIVRATPMRVLPTTVASRLSGVQVSPDLAKLPVTGVMVENSDQARPQSGLSQSGVVFEALAEGGITRFLALYEDGQPTSIGPVRSARPYFIDWMLPFDASYAHVGGSPTALSNIQSLHVKDLNQFYNSGAYTRVSSRQAPHNVYTSSSSLISLEQTKGWTTSNFVGFPRKSDEPSKTPVAVNIDFNISTTDMEVHYQYNPSLNNYLRSEGGASMVDANSGQQLAPKVVIAMVVPWTDGALDSSNAYYTVYSDIGSGAAYIFQDGIVAKGEWKKTSPTSQIQFETTSGLPIKLNTGQAWITAVGAESDIKYTP